MMKIKFGKDTKSRIKLRGGNPEIRNFWLVRNEIPEHCQTCLI